MTKRFDVLITIIVAIACVAFLWGVFVAGQSSLSCDPPQAPKPAMHAFGKCDDKTGYPFVNPFLVNIITPLIATFSTYFGAAIGVGGKTGARRHSRLPLALRWGALVGLDDDRLSVLQTLSAYVYLAGLIIGGVYLYLDSNTLGEDLTSPYIHLIIKNCGTALAGTVVGVVAIALGVRTQTPKPVKDLP